MTAPANFASIVEEYQLMEMTELDPDYERLYRALQDHLSILPEAVGPGNILQGNQVCNQFVNHSGCRGRAPASAHQCAFLHPEFVDARWMPRDNICYRHLRQQARHPEGFCDSGAECRHVHSDSVLHGDLLAWLRFVHHARPNTGVGIHYDTAHREWRFVSRREAFEILRDHLHGEWNTPIHHMNVRYPDPCTYQMPYAVPRGPPSTLDPSRQRNNTPRQQRGRSTQPGYSRAMTPPRTVNFATSTARDTPRQARFPEATTTSTGPVPHHMPSPRPQPTTPSKAAPPTPSNQHHDLVQWLQPPGIDRDDSTQGLLSTQRAGHIRARVHEDATFLINPELLPEFPSVLDHIGLQWHLTNYGIFSRTPTNVYGNDFGGLFLVPVEPTTQVTPLRSLLRWIIQQHVHQQLQLLNSANRQHMLQQLTCSWLTFGRQLCRASRRDPFVDNMAITFGETIIETISNFLTPEQRTMATIEGILLGPDGRFNREL